jgi:hypothetical protein
MQLAIAESARQLELVAAVSVRNSPKDIEDKQVRLMKKS